MILYISFEMKFLKKKEEEEESISVWDTLSFNVDLVTKRTSGVWKQRTRAKERRDSSSVPNSRGASWLNLNDLRRLRHEETREEPWEDARDDMQTGQKGGEDRDKRVRRISWYTCGKTRTRWRQSGPSETRNTGKVKACHKDINHLPPSCSEKSEASEL